MATATEVASEVAVTETSRKRFDFAAENKIVEKSLRSDSEAVEQYFAYRATALSDENVPAPTQLQDKFFVNAVEANRFRVRLLTTRREERVKAFEETLSGLDAKIAEAKVIVEKADEMGEDNALRYAAAKKKAAELQRELAALAEEGVDTAGILEEDEDEI